MPGTDEMKKLANFCIALIFLLLGGSCAAPLTTPPVPVASSGTFTVYLQPMPQEAHLVTFTLNSLAARGADGSEIPLVPLQKIFPAESLIGVQKRLSAAVLPPGRYHGLVIGIESATLRGEEGEVDLLPPEMPLMVDYEFTIIRDRAETLFLSLSPERIVTNGVLFTPKFSLWEPERLLTNLKGFVSNSGADSLMVFDKRNMQAIGAISTAGMPLGMVLDQRNGWLYTALAGEDRISVIEVSNGEILGSVRLRFGDEPSELALSPSGNLLVSINRGSYSASIIDTASLFERDRITLTSEPTWVFMGRDDGSAYVIEAATGTIAVLDLGARRVRTSVQLDDPPIKGAASADGSSLYLITGYSGNLLVVDTASLQVTKRIFIGSGALSLKSDKTTGLIYVGMESGEIAVVDPRSLLLIDSFYLTGPVQHLTIDNEENAMFAVLPRDKRLQKIDLVSKQSLGSVELEAGGHAVVVMGER